MFTRAMRWTYLVLAWIILAAVVLQVFLAGLGVFAGPSNFETHRLFGYTLSYVMLIAFIVALAARLSRRLIILAALLPILVFLQSVFILFRENGQSALAALHVVNALAIFALSGYLALQSLRYVPARTSKSAPSTATPEPSTATPEPS